MLETATQLRSARLVRHVRAIHAAANAHPDNPPLVELAGEIDAVLKATRSGEEEEGEGEDHDQQ